MQPGLILPRIEENINQEYGMFMSLLIDVVMFLRTNGAALNLSPLDRLVLISIASRIGTNDNTWVKQITLAQEFDISDRQIRKVLTKLSALSFIKISKINTNKAKQNQYTIEYDFSNYRNCSSASQDTTTGTVVPIVGGTTGTVVPVPTGTVVPIGTVIQSNTALQPQGLPGFDASLKSKEEKYKEKRKSKKKEKEPEIELPKFLSIEQWEEFLEHRKSIKSPMSFLAQKKAINLLNKFYAEGQDITEILDQSIRNGWKGLFPLQNFKPQGANGNGIQKRTERSDSILAYLDRLHARH